jgi:isocitrate/isopropylmalate dehydrogenase
VGRRLEAAVRDALAEGVGTPDVGGLGTTATVGDWICARLEAAPVGAP